MDPLSTAAMIKVFLPALMCMNGFVDMTGTGPGVSVGFVAPVESDAGVELRNRSRERKENGLPRLVSICCQREVVGGDGIGLGTGAAPLNGVVSEFRTTAPDLDDMTFFLRKVGKGAYSSVPKRRVSSWIVGRGVFRALRWCRIGLRFK